MVRGRRIEHATFDEEAGTAMLTQRNVITKVRYQTVKCKFCGDWESVVQYGRTAKGTQRYLCQKCGRTFLDNKAPERMQYPIEAVALALNMFYESASLPKIQRQLNLLYGFSPQPSTIYYWIVRYSKKAAKALNNVPVKTSSTWVADETVIKLKGEGKRRKKGEKKPETKPKRQKGSKAWFWDIIDDKTRFLLASHLSETRTTKDAQALMEKAATRAKKVPRVVTTDKLAAYLDGIELVFGADTKHIQAETLTSEPKKQLIERFHGTLKDREKVMRSLMTKKTAEIITEGWLAHYNFFRPHRGLKGKTPAEAAEAKAPYRTWRDVIEKE